MKQIVAFGDRAFNTPGVVSWPEIASHLLESNFINCSQQTCTNLQISKSIYDYFADHSSVNTLIVINWTRVENKFVDLQSILATQYFLRDKAINCIQTYSDNSLFEKTPEDDISISIPQELVYTFMDTFDNQTFWHWANQYQSLSVAHQEASRRWVTRYTYALGA
jgi:hypothetical protein